ncbi:Pex12 amino terminal region-domain-containing protein [Aspergillus cavernicola]|uniref:ATPase synthesis protein 25 n=1 Tax=Aspergillus cavernicola TaxID=176166 RepID=A0ABR4IN11_9EURO
MLNRTLLRAPRCYQEVLRASPSPSYAAIRHTFLAYSRVRTLTSIAHLSLDPPASSQSTSSRLAVEEKEAAEPKSTPEPSQHIPWYLQEESAIPEPAEVFSSDQLPDLPEHPPKILPELLEYVFKDIGLDELKLFDLRELETPSALGANVIMIIGTARSVKHLNVSADRLCRWLRSSWKLTPYADGLLGRNELKIKLRRKTRRARLASRTGTTVDDKDDGITTGWICVNAGIVEKGPVQEQREGAFEGFGHLGGGTRVVVQMFTEEKRAELNLDGLWEATLARAQRAKQRNSNAPVDDAPEKVRSPNSISPSPSDYETSNAPRSSVSLPIEQRRQLHSKHQHQHSRLRHNVTGTRQFMSWSRGPEPREPLPSSMLLQYLSGLQNDQVKFALGDNPEDPNSTEFLRNYYSSLADSPTADMDLAKLELIGFATSRQHPGYSKENIHRAFMDCCIAGCDITDSLSSQVVRVLLAPRTGDDPELGEWLPDSDKELALSVLDQIVLRGANVMSLELFNMLYSAMSLPSAPGEDDISPADKSAHILRMIETLDIPFDAVQARILMLAQFRNGDFEGFYKWWRKLPLNNSPRNYEDYEMLFRLHAELGDQHLARQCLATWAPMMSREDPPIPLMGEIVNWIMDCLYIADPDIQARAVEGSKGDLTRLWRQVGLSVSIAMEYLPSLQQEFDELKPSLFELLAEQQLSDLLPPSIRYILAVATHRHPRYLLRVLNSFDEVYALLSLLVERYYLRNFGGSFTENFYSLKRERVLLTKNGEIPRAQLGAPGPVRDSLKLRTADVWKNILIMVGIPYLKRKLDEGYDIHAAPQASLIMSGGPRYSPSDDLPPSPTIRQRLMHAYKWFLRNVYPSVNAAYYFSIIVFNIAYLFDNTKYSSPFLWLIGTRIRRLNSADHHAIAKILEGKPQTPGGARTRPGSGLLSLLSPQNLYPQLLTSLRYFLPASIFALKFLEWWHASDFSRQLARKATDALDIPAPITKGMIPPSERKQKPSPEQDPTTSPSHKSTLKSSSPRKRIQPPISASSYLPIFTVPLPPDDSDAASSCPVCLNQLTNPTACQTGYVYCYVCIFQWLTGEHQRQLDFMNRDGAGAAWEDDLDNGDGDGDGGNDEDSASRPGKRRQGKWESGKGRCPVTGRRVLGGTEGLRRVLV